ncbi:MAG: non-hydrolyzing UDP-N-acetylglucosamine 2-epimerase, partial [Fidelibacterota bacterium]
GTRPEVIRLSRVISALDQYTDHILVHTGQNYDYELNKIFFNDLGIRKPDYFLEAAGKNSCETIGNIIIGIDPVLAKVKPEALLVLGDTNSCLSVIPAKRRQIPIFHMEAGNRCFDQRVPEEINRKIIDHIADINLPYSDIAREYLLREGLPPGQIIKTGSPMFEVLNYYRPKIDKSHILIDLKLKKNDYIVLSAHREENIEPDGSFRQLIDAVNKISDVYGKRIIVSTHPRTRNRIDTSITKLNACVELMKPMGFCDYVKLQENSMVVLSDSGTINEESSILNFPALNLRDTHERPEGMEEAAVIMTGLKKERIIQGIELVKNQPREKNRYFRKVSDYTMPNVSEKIVRIILSHTDYVNRVVWSK